MPDICPNMRERIRIKFPVKPIPTESVICDFRGLLSVWLRVFVRSSWTRRGFNGEPWTIAIAEGKSQG